jgi:hypothetical protein
MAALAAVCVWSAGELTGMLIPMAVAALRKLEFVDSILALREMALIALHLRMLALQRISSGSVLLHAEGGGFEAVHGVAGSAFPSVWPFGELATVRIGLMTIDALPERDRSLEVALGMALHAIDFYVFAQQRKLCLGVIDTLA